MNKRQIIEELEETFSAINHQIGILDDIAMRQRVSVHELQNRDGSFPVTPLLCARAQVLCTLATLKGQRTTMIVNDPPPPGVLPRNVCKGEPMDKHPDCRNTGFRHQQHVV